ncbi:MAG: tRNA (adenosine(37)-N6)-threonylcarbamoyltransferase complex ATPase subunit type 1 TsaE [Patescibacteria group bacterium]|jgi:tRNA threonylcarbamoyladenosine biosynthesis protein TsaE
MDYLSKSLKETENLAAQFLSKNPDVRLIGLVGDLGSGKSAFVKGVAKFLGISKNVTSPTFVIMKNYKARSKKLIHIDAYRLENINDLNSLGFDELLSDDKNLIFIEWPEKVFVEFPQAMKIVKFKYINDETRQISF